MNAYLRRVFLLMCLLLIGLSVVQAQENVTVPDVSGLTVPQAAAALNRSGLRLGTQTNQEWSAESGVEANRVGGQSVAPGEMVTRGTAIDLVVLNSANITMMYDDNDLTVVNESGVALDSRGLRFVSVEGSAASFDATRWSNVLRETQCFQIWTVGRNGPKDVDQCQYIQAWLSTINPEEHFWTQTSGVMRFSVQENGIERAVCDAAPPNSQNSPLTCEFYYSGGQSGSEVTEYVYLVYSTEAIVMLNKTEDRWMPTTQTTLYNYNPGISVQGAPLTMGDPVNFGNPDTVADLSLLAPGQCLLYTTGSPDSATPPEACDVIAHANLDASVAFWTAAFEVGSASDGQRRSCPAATEGKLTLCVMPV